MFPRSIIAGLLSALFAGAALGVQAQTLPAADAMSAAAESAAPAAAAVVVPEDFVLSAPMAGPSVPVITAPGAAPIAAPAASPNATPQAATNAAPISAPASAPAAPQATIQSQPAQPAAPAVAANPLTTGTGAGTQSSAPSEAAATTSVDLIGALLSGQAAGVKLAFLLPSPDSPFEEPSQRILQGVLAANYASGSPIEVLLVRPGANESAASMLKRAAMAGAMAAIGPLDRSKVSEIAALEYTPLPVIALNQIDMNTAVPLTEEELAEKRAALQAKRANEQHMRELLIAETNEALGSAETTAEGEAEKPAGSITTHSTVPGLVFAEELAVSPVRYEPITFPHNLLMLGLSMEDDASRVAALGLAALPPTTSAGTQPKVLLIDHDTPLEKRISSAFERTLVAAGYAPDRLTVDLNQFQRVSKFFDLAVERLDETEFNEELIDQEADPVGWRQQQIRIRRLKAAKRARAALSEPPYHAVFLAMDAKTASLVRSRLPIRSRIWGTPIINPGDPKTDPQAKAMTYDLLQVALVDSPLVLQFDADEFEDIYRVPAPQTTLQKRLFALGADAFAAASSIAHGTTSASFDGLLGTVAYNLSLSPKAERRGQTAMIFGGELRIMDENAVVEYESFKTNSRRMRAQARSLERLQREAQQAARKAGTLIEETSDNAPRLDDMLDSYNFSGGSSAQPAAEPEPVTMPMTSPSTPSTPAPAQSAPLVTP